MYMQRMRMTVDEIVEQSEERYLKRLAVYNTLPVEGYEEEIELASDIEVEHERLYQRSMNQPWIQALLDQRQYDNENLVHMQGRTYEVTDIHLQYLKRLGLDMTRLCGYDLIEVPEDKYLADHFEDGKRIKYLSDRNLHPQPPQPSQIQTQRSRIQPIR